MLTINELNKLYSNSETCDAELFAEQRSNILLVSGDHYSKKGSKYLNRVRDSESLSKDQKLRITKNHIQKISKTYVNNISSYAPSVIVTAKNDSELQDQKAAELHGSVLEHIKYKYSFNQKRRQWIEDYVNIGEVAVKIYFDPNSGDFRGFKPEIDPFTGMQVESKEAIFSGELKYERIFGFNLLRAPEAKSMDESPYIISRKMIYVDKLKEMVGEDEEKLSYINPTQDDTYLIFDGQSGEYRNSKDQCLLLEYYFRPCSKYPRGYYVYATQKGKLFEGELPFGIFPIVYCGFDELETSARSRSIIKQLRPYQVEINRAASKIAEHQITLGDDKLLVQKGTTITNGGTVPGVRAVQYSGVPPTILSGRGGEQYLNYMLSQIEEMYKVSNVYEDSEEKNAQVDPYTLLFRTMRNKKKFSLYAEKFENFLINVAEISLELYRQYVSDDEMIEVLGRREYVNIAEFKNAKPLGYQIKLEAGSDDIETKMGKMLSFNHILQYVGTQLDKDQIGKLISVLPYVGEEEAFSDLTIDYKNATNDILALDRGEYPKLNDFDNHVYMIKRLTSRMKQSDFRLLPANVQENYYAKLKEHELAEAEVQRKLIAAKSEYIPTDGYFVVCDFYVPDPKDPLKKERVKIPSASLQWLITRLEDQGNSLDSLSQMQPEVQAHLASAMNPADMQLQQIGGQNLAENQGGMNVS